MRVGVSEAGDRVEVIGGGVPLVPIESVPRIAGVEFAHFPVAQDLRDDRGRGNRGAAPVAVKDGALGHRQFANPKGVDQDDVRQGRQRENGAAHRRQRGLMDIDGVDFAGIGGRDRPGNSVSGDFPKEIFAFFRGDGLRIADAGDVAVGVQNDRGRVDGTRQAAAAGFVDPGYMAKAKTAQLVLERSLSRNTHSA